MVTKSKTNASYMYTQIQRSLARDDPHGYAHQLAMTPSRFCCPQDPAHAYHQSN